MARTVILPPINSTQHKIKFMQDFIPSKNAARQIYTTIQVLKEYSNFNELTLGKKNIIINSLRNIAIGAMNDFQNRANNQSRELNESLSNSIEEFLATEFRNENYSNNEAF